MAYTFFEPTSRRFKALWVTPELLMNAILSPQREGGEIRVVKVEGLPEGAKIQALYWCEDRMAFGVRIWHESFEEVKDCGVTPTLKLTFSEERLHVLENAGALKWTAAAEMRDDCVEYLRSSAAAMRQRRSAVERPELVERFATVLENHADFIGTFGRLTTEQETELRACCNRHQARLDQATNCAPDAIAETL